MKLKMIIKEFRTEKEYSVELNYDIVEKYILELFKVTNTDISKIPTFDDHEILSGDDLNKFLMQLGIYSKKKDIFPVIKAIYNKFPDRKANFYDIRLKMII